MTTLSTRERLVACLLDGALLSLFMVSACVFALLLFHPDFPASRLLPSQHLRRGLMGLAMGLTCVALVYSPWGRRSGAQMNPSATLAFVTLGRMRRSDAAGYVAAQVGGAVLGIAAVHLAARELVAHGSVRYVATVPGPSLAAAWLAEFAMAFGLMTVVLAVAASRRHAALAGLAAGMLVALFIWIEAPVSGMSLNPARSLGSALFAGEWESLWLYASAPPVGMWLAARLRRMFARGDRVCAKLCHLEADRCVHCGQGILTTAQQPIPPADIQ